MTESTSTRDLIDRLFQQSGIKKKLAAEILHVMPEIIEEGLLRDGEVRVKGLGTFRLKWTAARTGRNPKTGESVEIPPHNRLVFLPEQSLKEFIDRDNRLLSYKVIPTAEAVNTVQSSKIKVQSEDSNTRNQKPETWNLEPETPDLEPEIDYSYEPEPEKPARRKRIHWIIPTAILVIIGLSIAFYFRNFNPVFKKTEVGSQKTEDSVQSSKIKVQSEDSNTRNQESGTWNLEPGTPGPQPETRIPQPVILNSQGKHLFQLARETYGNPFLWVLIYKANLDKIPNPDVVISGKELIIPVLEGKPRQLSHNDSVNVADGYRLVYEFYFDKGDPRAEEFRQAYLNYKSR